MAYYFDIFTIDSFRRLFNKFKPETLEVSYNNVLVSKVIDSIDCFFFTIDCLRRLFSSV